MPFGLAINNADGVPILDYRKRNMEAVAWGSVTVPNRDAVRINVPANVFFPLLFINFQAGGYIVKGNLIQDGSGSYFYVAADRSLSIRYVVGGFRPNSDGVGGAGAGYGLTIFDADGRLSFSTKRAYIRFPYRSMTLGVTGSSPSQFLDMTMVSGGSPAYQHPAWGANDYIHWNPGPAWSKDSGAFWFTGFYAGPHFSDPRYVAVGRVDLANRYFYDYRLGGALGDPPGTTGLLPLGLLSCNFITPA